MRYLSADPAAELSLPCYEKRLAERIVGEDDVQRLVETDAKPRDKVLLRLLYAAGLRVSEACGLLWRNVRPRGESGQVTVFGKNGRTRSIVLTAPLWAELTALRGNAHGGAGFPISKREAPGPRARPRNRAPGGKTSGDTVVIRVGVQS
jgi:integrase/recombinase XerD